MYLKDRICIPSGLPSDLSSSIISVLTAHVQTEKGLIIEQNLPYQTSTTPPSPLTYPTPLHTTLPNPTPCHLHPHNPPFLTIPPSPSISPPHPHHPTLTLTVPPPPSPSHPHPHHPLTLVLDLSEHCDGGDRTGGAEGKVHLGQSHVGAVHPIDTQDLVPRTQSAVPPHIPLRKDLIHDDAALCGSNSENKMIKDIPFAKQSTCYHANYIMQKWRVKPLHHSNGPLSANQF